MTEKITFYIDFKSPYAYLAMAPVRALAKNFDIEIDILPYTLNIPDYLGSAKVSADGKVLEENRNAHQWRRVRYSYFDARRYANLQGLTVRGPQKIFDSSLANIGLLWIKETAPESLDAYIDSTFEKFWKRELDIEEPAAVSEQITAAGGDSDGFQAFLADDGRAALMRLQKEAETQGIFGVPSFIVDGELFWGREHLELIADRLRERGVGRVVSSKT